VSDPLAGGFRIGDHAVEPARGRIVSPAGETHVEPRAMDVLVALARKAGDTVGRDELIESVWKHPYVSDEALSRCISLLRHALGDDRSQPRYLETIPKRGYRLMAPVEVAAGTLAERERQGRSGEDGRAVPDPNRTNLGLQRTRIIGREGDWSEVRALLASERAPEMLLEALALADQIGLKILGAHVTSLVAALAAFTKSWHRAARLHGAACAQCEELGFAMEPVDAAFVEPMISRARDALGKEAFASDEAEGRMLSYGTTIAEAGAWLREREARRVRIA
jgi:DNA-binding winged helix-turn-helix (wHTH) protein